MPPFRTRLPLRDRSEVPPGHPGLLQEQHDGVGGEEVLALPPMGLPVAAAPGHRAADHPAGVRPGPAGDKQALALRPVPQDVVHWGRENIM